MKVVVAHNRYVSAQPSGENTVVEAELRLLAKAGVVVLPFLRSSDEIPALPLLEKVLLPISPIYARRAQQELSTLIARARPDVLHLHNPYPLLSPWMVRTAHAHRVPVVQTVHNFRHVCASGIHFRGGSACHDCVGKAYPYPAIQHACYRGSRLQSVVMATALAAHRATWRSVDRYVALTPAIADHLRRFGVRDEQITVRPNGVPDPGRHDVRGDGFLFAGRLSVEKGIRLLLAGWCRHREGAVGRLRIAGDGPLRAEVETMAALRPDIEYVGRLDPADMARAMREAAAVVVPSTWDEVFPMVAVEALANARPVLGTTNGSLPHVIGADTAQPAGWVVPPTIDGLAAALPRAQSEAAALVGVARQRYESAFAPHLVMPQLLRIYEDLVARPAGEPQQAPVSSAEQWPTDRDPARPLPLMSARPGDALRGE